MTAFTTPIQRTLAWIIALAVCLSTSVFAGDMHLTAKLIWGTETPQKDPKLTLLNSEETEKLKKIFKWKHYYSMKEDKVKVTDAVSKVKMSDKCEVEVQSMGKSGVEVKLFGEGKLVKTVKQPIPPGEMIVLAGDDKNDTAWFVILSVPK